jgi:hypothetical protein
VGVVTCLLACRKRIMECALSVNTTAVYYIIARQDLWACGLQNSTRSEIGGMQAGHRAASACSGDRGSTSATFTILDTGAQDYTVSLVSCCDKRAAANLVRCPASLRARRSQHVHLRARRRRPTHQHAYDTPSRRRAPPRRAHGRSRASRPAAGERRARPRAASPPPPRTVPPPLTGHRWNVDIRHSATKRRAAVRATAVGHTAEPAAPTAALPSGGCRAGTCHTGTAVGCTADFGGSSPPAVLGVCKAT